ncbi:sugar dehydrogenase complex small subunit [Marinomonas ostreistagni]|uniref:sugar dehydrogenase complex small subunit n=1 Tax=Marinomonas ostreistagni TaxID=359209 RepID=UPI0019510D10|nr:sugar dehydrogenase complex small subunit [Marinomonas ostreistagni]MBM6551845.1 twin-arginine translocation signal domain-containing protein [Marinomonas ostreistagni]
MSQYKEKAGISRRGFLTASAALSGLTLVPFASQAQAAATDAKAFNAFMALSQLITAKSDLNPALADTIYLSLAQQDEDFAARIKTLNAFVADHNLTSANLQARLDAEQPDVADLPRKLAKAWFQGIVGEGKAAKTISYSDNTLMYAAVADVLAPPSYALGAYGIWSSKPPQDV